MANAPASPFRVFRTDLDQVGWTHGIAIGEIHAIVEPERVARFVELLDQEPLVDKVGHERLDLVLVNAPAIDLSLLVPLATRAWTAAGRQSR